MCQQVKETQIDSMLPDMAHQRDGGQGDHDWGCHKLSVTARAPVLIFACGYVYRLNDMLQNRSTLKNRILCVFTFSTALICFSN